MSSQSLAKVGSVQDARGATSIVAISKKSVSVTKSTATANAAGHRRRRRKSAAELQLDEIEEPGAEEKDGAGGGVDDQYEEDAEKRNAAGGDGGGDHVRTSAQRKRKKKPRQKGQLWIDFKKGLRYCWSVFKFLLAHPTWRMRKRQATVLTACICQLANMLTIFMAKTNPDSVYPKIYNLSPGDIGLELFMYIMDVTLCFTGYSGTAWHALPWLATAPFYWAHQLYCIGRFIISPPTTIYQTIRLYDLLTRAVVVPYFYLVIYSAFGYLVTKLKVGISYDPHEEHVPVITPDVIEQLEKIAAKQGMSAPEALLYIYKRTGTNWGVTSTALKFDPNAKLPQYRGR